jgi:glycosyltransferase 2 family protein
LEDAKLEIPDPRAVVAPASPPTADQRTSPQFPLWARRSITLLIVVATVLFAYVAISDINFRLVWHALRTSNYLWLIPALVVFGLGTVARALRWRSLFALGRRPPRTAVLNATIVGYFYNNILPARAGEAARVVVLTQRSSTSAVEIVGTVVVERLFDLIAILLIFFAAEPWLPHVRWLGTAAIAAVVVAGILVAAVTILAVYGDRPLRLLLRPLRRFSWFSDARLDRSVDELVHGLTGLREGAVAFEAFAWTVAAWMLSALCAYCVSLAFHLHLPFASAVLTIVAVGLSMIIPSPPGAIGVFEAAALVALKVYGVPLSAALPDALVLHAVNLVPFILMGPLLMQYNARHPRRARMAHPTTVAAQVPSALITTVPARETD